MTVFAYTEAVRHLEQALKIQDVIDPDDKAKRCDLLLALGDALGPTGQTRRLLEEVAEEAFVLAEALQNAGMAARVCRMALLGYHRQSRGANDQSPVLAKWAERADRCAGPGTPERVFADLALGLRLPGESEQAQQLFRRALTTARDLGDAETFFFAARPFTLNTIPSREAERFERAQETAQFARQGVSSRVLASELSHCAYQFFNWGHRERAEAFWRDVEEIAERTRDAGAQIYPLRDQMMRLFIDGRLEDSVALRERLVELTEQSGSTQTPQLNQLTRVFLYLGRAEEALSVAALGGRDGAPLFMAPCYADSGDRKQAQKLLADLLLRLRTDAAETEPVSWSGPLLILLEVAVLVEDREAVDLVGPRLAGLAHLAGTYRYPNCVARHLGAASALLGKPDEARAYYDQAIEVCTKVRFRPDLALSRL
jgi:tetratricopeptide (TPR) repeat protein